MRKKTLWKDIRTSIAKSKGRFVSIICLIMLGTFALIGLKVTGPDMRQTGQHYFAKQNAADLTVMSDYGLSQADVEQIKKSPGLRQVEFGYLKDLIIKHSATSFRLFSTPNQLSRFEVKDGRLPKNLHEIAVDANYKDQYPIGSSIDFSEKADIKGNYLLKEHRFKVVGHVYSPEILNNINLGPSKAGSGELKGYALVTPQTFASDVYMLARLAYKDTQKLDPYTSQYSTKIRQHKQKLQALLASRPQERLAEVKRQAQEDIDQGQIKIKEAKQKIADNEAKLKDAQKKLADGKIQLADKEKEYQTKIQQAQDQLAQGAAKLAAGQTSLDQAAAQLAEGKQRLDQGKLTIQQKGQLLDQANQQLAQAKQSLVSAKEQLDAGGQTLLQAQNQLTAGYQQLASGKQALMQAKDQLTQKEVGLKAGKDKLAQAKTAYQALQSQLAPLNQKQTILTEQMAGLKNEITQLSADNEGQKANLAAAIAGAQAQVNQLTNQLADPKLTPEQQAALQNQLSAAQAQVSQSQANYNQFVAGSYIQAQQNIAAKQAKLTDLQGQLAQVQEQANPLQDKSNVLGGQVDMLQSQIDQGESALDAARQQLAIKEAAITKGQASLDQKAQILAGQKTMYESKVKQYNDGQAAYQTKLNQYQAGLDLYHQGLATLDQKSQAYQEGLAKYQAGQALLADKANQLSQAQSQFASKKADGQSKLDQARHDLVKGQSDYEDKLAEFKDKKADALAKIKEKEADLQDAKDKLETLTLPEYLVDSRREIPGAEGYKIYTSISEIVDSLGNIFPVFLYLVAALVTSNTMTRFVDEERTISGTLKALGYSNRDVMKKFVVYGMAASLIGALIGIVMGHTLLPWIVYNAYHNEYTLPAMEWHLHWGLSLLGIFLALLAAVVPAILVVSRELTDRPANLLLPKAPVQGSMILLERIPFIWSRLSFTHKVTARNIFRYKKRMLMTIFGVAGSVALLFAGLGVQHSISGINDRQFGDLIRYDLIIAANERLTTHEQDELNQKLKDSRIAQQTPVHFEEVKKVAGAKQDQQEIKVIVPSRAKGFEQYIQTLDRRTQKQLSLNKNGVLVSERLANLLRVKIGDSIQVKDADGKARSLKISGITEMYLGHFILMNPETYQESFHQTAINNGHLLILKQNNVKAVRQLATDFMELEAVKGVVQNITLSNQIQTIVHSLNKIMRVLIIVAIFLAIVILYNLTNINVSERIRELSTIKVLGFHNKEVTLYIYRETFVLSLLGVLVGYGLGNGLHRYIIDKVAPDHVMFDPIVGMNAYLIPAVVTILITVILGFLVNRRLRHVNMLEALKSVE
ncbi:FtsX-like permease family protein [Vaginisenegalia massiliensis]|uniref:FtsX-like permease family protein n=1 Tax=Vaginisenegalia massiliensis TaxID=2058294 RepID=UPI000F5396A3|nr:FtsX-like permease family protein [Vaginisenegalia massiliensis]